MSSPLTSPPLVATGDPKTAWFGWPKDDEIEKLRTDFIAATTDEARQAALDGLQERFYEFFPYYNTASS